MPQAAAASAYFVVRALPRRMQHRARCAHAASICESVRREEYGKFSWRQNEPPNRQVGGTGVLVSEQEAARRAAAEDGISRADKIHKYSVAASILQQDGGLESKGDGWLAI